MPEYRKSPKKFAEPTDAEIKARTFRNIAIAIGLLLFMVLVAASIVMRTPV